MQLTDCDEPEPQIEARDVGTSVGGDDADHDRCYDLLHRKGHFDLVEQAPKEPYVMGI